MLERTAKSSHRLVPNILARATTEDVGGSILSALKDLRQARLFEPYKYLSPEDREDFGRIINKVNTLRRVEEALATGHVQTPTFIPEFYADKTYIEVLQWLCFFSIRGYLSEHRKPARLQDIYYRVIEKIKSARREGSWPEIWKLPSKRTIDRRVNEIASSNVKENRIMSGSRARVIATTAGEYCPNPSLYEDVSAILRERV